MNAPQSEVGRAPNGTTPRAGATDPTIAALGGILREFRAEAAAARAEARIEVAALRSELEALRAEASSGSRAAAGPSITNAEVVTSDHDPRSFDLVLWMADGSAMRCPFKIAVPLHRGLFDPLRAYVLNDLVAFGGHSWIARRTTQNEEPGRGSAWHLCAKRGARGPSAEIVEKLRLERRT